MEDLCQLSNTQTKDKYNGSYEKWFTNVIHKYSDYETIDKINFYRLLLFCNIIGNTDMHHKNFTWYAKDDRYQLTPTYDLVPVMIVFSQEDMVLTLNGKSKIWKNDFYKFGDYLDIKKEFNERMMFDFINETPLDKKLRKRFCDFIVKKVESRY